MDHDEDLPVTSRAVRFEANTVAGPGTPSPGAQPLPRRPEAGPVQLPRPAAPSVGRVVLGVVRTTRPQQWPKNLLVLAAPLASGTVFRGDVLVPSLVAFVLFCGVAGGVYLLNDVRDVELDRRHPRKRHRPVAAGTVPVPVAAVAGAALIVGTLAVAVVLARPQLVGVLATYAVVSLAYTWALKDQPVIDLAVVASGFLLRGVAGGVAAAIPLSQWFLLVAAFGALFVVAGKRYAELVALGEEAGSRRCLSSYSPSYLRFVWGMSAGVTCTAYSLWAFEMRAANPGMPFATMSIAPFVLVLLRYAVDVDRGAAGAPEEIVVRDRGLLALGAVWALLVGLDVLTR